MTVISFCEKGDMHLKACLMNKGVREQMNEWI